MNDALVTVEPDTGFAAAQAAFARLGTLSLASRTEDEVFDVHRDLERVRRWLPSVEHQLIVEEQARGVAQSHGCRDEAAFLVNLLNIDPRDASARVKAADACGARRALTGEPLPPVYEHVAAAQAPGQIAG